MQLNKSLHTLILAGLLSGNVFAEAAKPAGNQVVAVVNGTPIPALYADIVRQDRTARGQANEAISDESVRDALINVEVLAQAASQKGLDKPDQIRAILDLQRKETLVKLLQEDFVKTHKIAEETLKAEYDKARAKAGDMEFHARHILVEDEKLAKAVIAELSGKKKLKFEDLAKKHSKDSSAKQGGDLGWMTPSNFVPEFSAEMVKLKKGEHTKNPVKSRFGWHIIKLEESRKLDFPEYEKVKERIAGQLMQIDYRKYVAELRSTANIDIPAK